MDAAFVPSVGANNSQASLISTASLKTARITTAMSAGVIAGTRATVTAAAVRMAGTTAAPEAETTAETS
jgi:hypothetical protein